MAADYLSMALDKLILGQREMTFKASRRCLEISHLAYADDIIIFTQAAETPLRQLRACLNGYKEVSGQQINLAKSNFYIAEKGIEADTKKSSSRSSVVWQTLTFIRNSMSNSSLKPKHWKGVRLGVNISSQATPRRPQPLAMMIKWNPPDQPWLKLNMDGSFNESNGKAEREGLIRDHSGRLLVAFALPLTAHSALEAELLAMHHGLIMAKEFVK
ncbi:uncharacterized protein LOC121788890 [Salvia splendens]|uniref:uncharacterized protein LOC121788890 n=1 Tax=Salvia splendens TaxID=180675 RepID=UPI001C268DAF|nr:uncharacterized protein LOC121788890 [Salvia splendens]